MNTRFSGFDNVVCPICHSKMPNCIVCHKEQANICMCHCQDCQYLTVSAGQMHCNYQNLHYQKIKVKEQVDSWIIGKRKELSQK